MAVPVLVAVKLAPTLSIIAADARRNGVVLDPAVAELVALCDRLRRVGQLSTTTPPPPPEAPPAPSWWPTVAEAAERLGVSRQAVEKRLRRGTLPARLDERGRWRVDPSAIPHPDDGGVASDDGGGCAP